MRLILSPEIKIFLEMSSCDITKSNNNIYKLIYIFFSFFLDLIHWGFRNIRSKLRAMFHFVSELGVSQGMSLGMPRW